MDVNFKNKKIDTSDLTKEEINFLKNICKNICDFRKIQKISQVTLANKIQTYHNNKHKKNDTEFTISQTDISNIENNYLDIIYEKFTMMDFLEICKILNINIHDLFTDSEHNQNQPVSTFITNPDSWEFMGYINTYYIYYLSTQKEENKIVEGKLELENKNDKVIAKLSIDTNRISHSKKGKTYSKVYLGNVFITHTNGALVFDFKNYVDADLGMIIFNHFHINSGDLDCRLGEAVTMSSGSNPNPTSHRVFMRKSPLSNLEKEFIIPFLHQETGYIILENKYYEKIEELSGIHINTAVNYLNNNQRLQIMPIEFLTTPPFKHLPEISRIQIIELIHKYNLNKKENDTITNSLETFLRTLLLTLNN